MKSGWLRLYSQYIGMLEVLLELMGLSVTISWSRLDYIRAQF